MKGAGTGNGVPAARCVLWHRAGVDVGPLQASLVRRGVELRAAHTPYAALAELCMQSREGGGAASPLSLVIVEPGTLGLEGQVARAASRYAPGAVVWAYQPSGRPPLRPVSEAEVAAWGGGEAEAPEVPLHPALNGARPASLKLTGSAPVAQLDEAEAPSGSAPLPSHVLTPEELAMLLADGEPGGGGRP